MEDLRQQLSFQHESIGLVIGIVFSALIGAGMCALLLPIGPAQPIAGVVTGFHFGETDEGSLTYARVKVAGQERLVRLNYRTHCRVGDRINLERTRTLTGARLRLRLQSPTCER